MKLRRVGALAGALLLTFGMVSSVFANAANPSGANPAIVSGHTVTLTGDWNWTSQDFPCAGDPSFRNVGWAFDWGDGFTGNFVQSKNAPVGVGFHVGSPQSGDAGFDPLNTDGNTVQTNGDCGNAAAADGTALGTWGPMSHTFASEGDHQVCLIMYDIHLDHETGLPKDGELIAGGVGNNDDNSAETNGLTPDDQGTSAQCLPITINVPKVPGISIEKTATPTSVQRGGEATYSYLVTNTGEIDLTDIVVIDDNGTPGDTGDDFQPDCNGQTTLAVGEDMTCSALVQHIVLTVTNVAVVTGHAGDDVVTDNDDALVTVLNGSVEISTHLVTGPPTDTIASVPTDAGGALPLMLVVLGAIGLGAFVLTPRRSRR